MGGDMNKAVELLSEAAVAGNAYAKRQLDSMFSQSSETHPVEQDEPVDPRGDDTFKEGDRVVLAGLTERPDLNGKCGKVYLPVIKGKPGRVGVEVAGEKKAVPLQRLQRALPGTADLAEAAEDSPNAQISAKILHSKAESKPDNLNRLVFFIYQYKKTPAAFLAAFKESAYLQRCRLALKQAGHDWLLPDSGAKVFVRPDEWGVVMDAIAKENLKLDKSHVVVSDEFDDSLDKTIHEMRSKERPNVKHGWRLDVDVIAPTSSTGAADLGSDLYEVSRTFLQEKPPDDKMSSRTW